MGYIRINSASMTAQETSLGAVVSKISDISSQLESARVAVNRCIKSNNNIAANIRTVQLRITNDSKSVFRLSSTLKTINDKFASCENKLLGFYKSAVDGDSKEKLKESSGDISIKWGNLISVLGQFGTVGGLASSLFSVANDRENIGKSVSKIVDSGVKTFGRIADGKKIDIWGTSTVDAIGFRENLAKGLDGYKINSSYNSDNMTVAAKNVHNVSAVAKWGGIAISGMLSFVDNMEEYEYDLSNPRVYAETVGETAVDVGLGIVVGAGVAALAGAAAPVWAVGVVGAGVTIGLDWLSETLTGKDVSELVTDTVLDTVEATGTVVKNVVEGVGDAIKATADCVSAGWKKFINLF